MAILSVTSPYSDGDAVTSTNLNALVTASTFDSGATDGSTTTLTGGGAISVKDAGVSFAKLASELGGAIREVSAGSGTAYVGGNKTGNARGQNALDIQYLRGTVQAVASGTSSVALGNSCKATGTQSLALGTNHNATADAAAAMGNFNTASGQFSTACGNSATASGNNSSSLGFQCTASANNSTSVGFNNNTSGQDSTLVGYNLKNTVANTAEFGKWNSQSARTSSVRMHPNSQVAFTIRDSASAPTDGGATAGSEADGTLGRGMFCFQKNGTAVTLFFNNNGSIQSLSLGTLS